MNGMVKAVAFDIDGTLVSENFWGALNNASGMDDETDAALMRRYHSKEITYREWMKLITEHHLMRPQTRTDIEELSKQYTYAPQAREIVNAVKAKYKVALVSSNIDVFVKRVALDLGIEHAYWFTDMRYGADDVFQEIGYAYKGDELEAKTWALHDFAKKIGVEVSDIAFVGDSRNDLAAFIETGKGVLVGKGDEELRVAAWKQIDTIAELTAIL